MSCNGCRVLRKDAVRLASCGRVCSVSNPPSHKDTPPSSSPSSSAVPVSCPLCRKIRDLESFNHLCVLFGCREDMDCLCMIYRLKSVPLSTLFSTSHHQVQKQDQDALFQPVHFWKRVTLTMGMAAKDGSLYYVSHENSSLNIVRCYMIPNQKSLEIRIHQTATDNLSSPTINYPIIVEINSIIYVLAATKTPPLTFRSVNLETNAWTHLEPPPCMSDPKFYPHFNLNYVVINDKLCVSNYAFSCAFDTRIGKWEACNLFDPFMYIEKENVPRAIMPEVKKRCGPPFPFVKQGAVVYSGFLIYTDYRSCDVVARKINNNGRLSRGFQKLVDGEFAGLWGFSDTCKFVHLGGGCFCILAHLPYDIECHVIPSELKFVKFEVSMATNGRSLTCSDVQISTVVFEQGSIWENVFSFFAC